MWLNYIYLNHRKGGEMLLMNIPNDSNESKVNKISRTDNWTKNSKVKSVDYYMKKARQMRSDQAWRLMKDLLKSKVEGKNRK